MRWFGVDSTSISSYSKFLSDVHWGKNKEYDKLKQLNLMVMYDMESELPVHYRNLPGNIPDSRTLRLLIEELQAEDFSNFGLILDRAYLTKENMTLFVGNGYKGIFMAKTSDSNIKKGDRKSRDKRRQHKAYRSLSSRVRLLCQGMRLSFLYTKEGKKGRGESAVSACVYSLIQKLEELRRRKLQEHSSNTRTASRPILTAVLP